MGLFKQMKDMKNTLAATPDMIEESQKMAANAQQMAAAQQAQMAAMGQQGGAFGMPAPPTISSTAATAVGPDFEPIEGVSLEVYSEIAKGLAAYNYDQTKGPEVAATKGVSAEAYQAATDGWNDRMKRNTAVAQRFNALYMGRE